MTTAEVAAERRSWARGEFLDLSRLQAFARSLASELRPRSSRSARWSRTGHLRRLEKHARILRDVYRTVADDVHRGETVSPSSEWLLDNFHLIANELRSIRHDLPRGYYRRLPKVAAGPPFSGAARIEVMAIELIRHSDGRIDAERLRGFVLALSSRVAADDRRAVGLAERAEGRADRSRGRAGRRHSSNAATTVRGPTPISRPWTTGTLPLEMRVPRHRQFVVRRAVPPAHPRVRPSRRRRARVPGRMALGPAD